MNQFGQNHRSLEVKVCPILKLLKKLKICQKLFEAHSLQLSTANTRLFQLEKPSSKILITIAEERSSFEPIQREALVIRSNSLVTTLIP